MNDNGSDEEKVSWRKPALLAVAVVVFGLVILGRACSG